MSTAVVHSAPESTGPARSLGPIFSSGNAYGKIRPRAATSPKGLHLTLPDTAGSVRVPMSLWCFCAPSEPVVRHHAEIDAVGGE